MSESQFVPPLFAMGTAVYARRAGEILILKRAGGAMSGSWYLPGVRSIPARRSSGARRASSKRRRGSCPRVRSR